MTRKAESHDHRSHKPRGLEPDAVFAATRIKRRSHVVRAIDRMPFDVHPGISLDTYDKVEGWTDRYDFMSLRPDWLQ